MNWMSGILNKVQRPPKPPVPPDILQDLPSDLISEWGMKAAEYERWWSWYDGTKLAEMKTDGETPKYPLQINPIRWVARIHAATLYGDANNSSGSLVRFLFHNKEGRVDDDCETAAKIVAGVWEDSLGQQLQITNAVYSQICGGCVYKVAWRPGYGVVPPRYGVKVSIVVPDYFMPVWDSEDPYGLLAAYVMYYISPQEAYLKYGVSTNNPSPIYMEKWDNESYEITVDGKVPQMDIPWKGKNEFGFVPFLYIPHLHAVNGYGVSHVPGLEKLVEEYNWRMGDRGLGVKKALADLPIAANITGNPQIREVGGMKFIYIGSSTLGSGKEPRWEVMSSNASSAADVSRQYTEDLWLNICRESSIPPTAWGEESVSSQRSGIAMSGLTLNLERHIMMERISTTPGLTRISMMILRILNKRSNLVTDRMLQLSPGIGWARIMPRDRMELVNEMSIRRASGLVSVRNAVSQLSVGEDVNVELEEIKRDVTAEPEQAPISPTSKDRSRDGASKEA